MFKPLIFTILSLAVCGLAFTNYTLYKKLGEQETVINTHGQLLQLITETPEINFVVSEELKRRQTPPTE